VIQEEVAKNGSRVLRHNGRLLASAVNPQAEATEWVQRRLSLINDVRSLFVLGAGAGYHIAELQTCTAAQILVIEHDLQVIEFVRSAHALDAHVQFECAQSSKQLRASALVREAIRGSFLVLTHSPSAGSQPEIYRDWRKQLLGRDWGALSWQWQLKGFADLDTQLKIGNSEALTIYDLESTELVQNSTERERMLIKALRELVK
jgi:hypothetical protein